MYKFFIEKIVIPRTHVLSITLSIRITLIEHVSFARRYTSDNHINTHPLYLPRTLLSRYLSYIFATLMLLISEEVVGAAAEIVMH